ncbi:hotdog fold thioesterase [Brachybacterium huguangmaarense]
MTATPAPLTGPDAERLAAMLADTLCERTGMEVLALGAEGGTMTMPVEGNTQPFGLLHGGATIALAESVASLAAYLRAVEVHGEGAAAVGTNVSAVHHRSAREGTVTAVCTPQHLGRQVATYAVEVRDEAGRLVSSVTVSTMLLPPRA